HATEKHDEKILIIYPMFTKNRRLEVQPDNLINLLKREGINVNKTINFFPYANKLMFLEGTGSLVLDRETKLFILLYHQEQILKWFNPSLRK
ncbi:MAG: arginine deiminase-related protein, partial [Arsenophonus sp. NC-PG7-MAG3]